MVSMRMHQRRGLPAQSRSSIASLSGTFAARRPFGLLRRQSAVRCTAVQDPLDTTAAAPALPASVAATTLQMLIQQQPENVHDGIYTCSIPKLCNTLKIATFLAAKLQTSPQDSVMRLRAAGPAAIAQTLKIIAKASAIVQQQTGGCFCVVFEPQREMLSTDHAGRWTVDLDKSRFNVMDFYVYKSSIPEASSSRSSSSSAATATAAQQGSHRKPFFIGKGMAAAAVKDGIVKAMRKQESVTCSAMGVGNVKTMMNGVAWARQQLLQSQLQGSNKQVKLSLQCIASFRQQPLVVKSAGAPAAATDAPPAAAAAAADTAADQQGAEQQQQPHQQHSHSVDSHTTGITAIAAAGGPDSEGQPALVTCFEVTVRHCAQDTS